MRALPNIGQTAKMPGILPVYIGMRVILTESYLPPQVVRGAAGTIVDIEVDPSDLNGDLNSRPSVSEQGCVLLKHIPLAVYVRVDGWSKNCLGSKGIQREELDLAGVVAVQPVTRQWSYKSDGKSSVTVSRTSIPLLPQKQCTLHGVQGKTAEPGFIAHWRFPSGLSKLTVWLAYYVSLSRPRSLSKLLSFGEPDRDIIEGGPPEEIVAAFKQFLRRRSPPPRRRPPVRAKPWAGRLENDIDWRRLNGSHRVLKQYGGEGGQCIADMSTPGIARFCCIDNSFRLTASPLHLLRRENTKVRLNGPAKLGRQGADARDRAEKDSSRGTDHT